MCLYNRGKLSIRLSDCLPRPRVTHVSLFLSRGIHCFPSQSFSNAGFWCFVYVRWTNCWTKSCVASDLSRVDTLIRYFDNSLAYQCKTKIEYFHGHFVCYNLSGNNPLGFIGPWAILSGPFWTPNRTKFRLKVSISSILQKDSTLIPCHLF